MLLLIAMHVVNHPSEVYTYCTVNGSTDIDVTCCNDAASRQSRFSRSFDEELVINDHNLIRIKMSYGEIV